MKNAFKIQDKVYGEGNCFIIAEAGPNHNGDVELAVKMIDVAKKTEVDAIKFQTVIIENSVSAKAPLAEYQQKNVPDAKRKTQRELAKDHLLRFEDFRYLKEYCDEKTITFLSTPFDNQSAKFLNEINVPAYKIASGEITNSILLDQIAKYQKPIIMSTGMATLGDIEFGLSRFYLNKNRDIILLHCITNYPADIEDSNLKAMNTLKYAFGHPVGLSDHTLGILVPILAIGLGAVLIEKHFTLDKSMRGPDHKASLEPEELKELVKSVRMAETALGDGRKIPIDIEKKIAQVARKSIVANTNIKQGEILTIEKLAIKRPGNGIDPRLLEDILDKKAKCDIEADSLLEMNMIEW